MASTIKDLCRLCARKHEYFKDLLDESNKNTLDLIRHFTQITVMECDNMPTKVCLDCEERIVSFQLFVLECYKVQDSLRKMCINSCNSYIKLEEEVELDNPGIKAEEEMQVNDVDIVKNELTAEDIVSAINNEAEVRHFEDDFQNDNDPDFDNDEDEDSDLDNLTIATLKALKEESGASELTGEKAAKLNEILIKPNFKVRELVKVASSSPVISQSDIDTESSDEEQDEPRRKKKQKKGAWIFLKKFTNLDEAQNALNEELNWSVHYTHVLKKGKKIYYRCNKLKKRGPQCPVKRFIFELPDKVLMYQTDADHEHTSQSMSYHNSKIESTITEAVKMEIDKLLALRLKPKAIITSLHKIEGIQMPKITQVSKYIADQRRRVLSASQNIDLEKLEQWFRKNSVFPEHLHEAFVVAHKISKDDATFCFVLSSKNLLEVAHSADVLHADTTCELVWQAYSVLVFGTTDKQQKFYPLALVVLTSNNTMSSKNTDDFQLVFKSIKEKIQTLFSRSFKPEVLVSNGTKSLENAFTEEFENTIVRICWRYAKKTIQSRIKNDVETLIQNQILEDIEHLHSITNQNAFKIASELFLHKYDEQRKFVAYFKEQWLVQNRNWYLGAAPGSPTTNNALKGFIKDIKDRSIIRERVELSRFLEVAKEMVNSWSIKYLDDPIENCFASNPLISPKDWLDSHNWAKLSNEIAIIPRDDKYNDMACYEVPGDSFGSCKVFENPPNNFDEFKEQFFSKWEVSLPLNKDEWAQGKCTCPTFFDTFRCKHVVGMAIRLKYTAPPPAIVAIAQRKKGRPSRAKHALIVP